MDSYMFRELLEMVTPLIERRSSVLREPISAEQRLLATLRFLGSSDSFEELKFLTAIVAKTIGKIIAETLIHVLKGYIKIPTNEDQWKVVVKQFEGRWNFPHCIGGIDGANGRVSVEGMFSNARFYERLVDHKLHIPQPDNLPEIVIKLPTNVLVGDD